VLAWGCEDGSSLLYTNFFFILLSVIHLCIFDKPHKCESEFCENSYTVFVVPDGVHTDTAGHSLERGSRED
jgi:hypothetical protein